MRITRLTADLREWWQHWFGVGVSTAPADRPKAEAAVTRMYSALGREAPRFLWVASPATGLIVQTACCAVPGSGLQASLRDGLRSLRASLGDSPRGSPRDSLWASLWASLGDSLGVSLWDGLRDGLRSLGASLRASLGDYWWGQHESYWVAHYTFGARLGVRYDPPRAQQLQCWADLAESCGWWAPYEKTAIMCDRPDVCRMEPTGRMIGGMPTYRLHADSGPALRYRDDWSIWAWHGVRVPQQLIEAPDAVSRETLAGERNAEIRRAYRERLGNERFAALLDLVEVDRDQVGHGECRQEYVLWRTREPDPVAGEHIQFAACRCHSTGRQYMLCVPPDIHDVYRAVAWTFPTANYAPSVEA